MNARGVARCWLILILTAALLMSGCESQQRRAATKRTATTMDATLGRVLDPLALQSDVTGFLGQLKVDTIDTANTIATRSSESRVREAAVRSKIKMSTIVQNLLIQRDPRLAYLYTWLLVEQSLYFLSEGQGKDWYGDQQQLMVAMLEKKQADVLEIGQRHFPDVDLSEVQEEVLAMARRYVAEHQMFSSSYDMSLVNRQQDKNAVVSLLSIPMAPVNALGGVGDMPTAVAGATLQVQQASAMINDMPERIRWQFELAMLQMDQYPVYTRSLTELEAARMSIDRIGTTVNGLPVAVRQELDKTIGDLTASQSQWQATIAEARQTVEQTNVALQQATTALAEVERVRDSLGPVFKDATETANAWQEVMAIIQQMSAKDPDAPPDPDPVTVRDYGAMAQEAREAATELRSLLTELQSPIPDESGLVRLSDDWKATLDGLTWRLAGLIVLMFVLAVTYRVLSIKLRGKSSRES